MNGSPLQPITGVVLAGGSSRRMGYDKSQLLLNGRPLIDHVVRAIESVCADVLIVAQEHQDFTRLNKTVVHDIIPDFGALMGLYTGLQTARTDRILVLACDMPYIQTGLLRYMCAIDHNADALVPRIDGHYEPLMAIYAKSCIPAIEQLIAQCQKSILQLYPKVVVHEVMAPEILLRDPDRKSFININTQQQYAAIEGN